jgi:hypothetical protein
MSNGLFDNGNARKTRLVLFELAAGCVLMAIMQIQGMLPSQDWIPAIIAKKLSFALAVTGCIIKACEMFFSKTSSLYSTEVKAIAVALLLGGILTLTIESRYARQFFNRTLQQEQAKRKTIHEENHLNTPRPVSLPFGFDLESTD